MLGGNTLEQRLNDQVFRHPLTHGIAGQFTVEQTLQPSQVQLAFVSRNRAYSEIQRSDMRCQVRILV